MNQPCRKDLRPRTDNRPAAGPVRLWADAFEHCAHGIAVGIPGVNKVLACNPAFARMLGRTVDDIIGADIPSLYVPEDRDLVARCMAEADRTGHVHYEARMLRADGSLCTVQMDTVSVAGTDACPQYRIATAQDITERKRIEVELDQSRKRLEFALQASHTGAWSLNLQDHTAARTLEHARIFGHPDAAGEWTLETFFDHVVPEDRNRVRQHIEHNIAAQTDWYIECRIRRLDGEVRWVFVAGGFEREAAGLLVHASGTIQDITERKQAELQLQKQEAALRGILNATKESVFLFDPNGVLLIANETAAWRYGKTLSQIIGRNFTEFMPPQTAQSRAVRFQEAIRSTQPIEFEDERAGILFRHSLYPISDASGTTTGVVCYSRDITEQKRAEAEIRRLAMAVEQAAEIFLITDTQGVIQYVNPAFERITGYSRQESIGRTPRLLRSGKHDERFYKVLWDTVQRGDVWSGHITNRRKDGTLYEEDAVISPVRDAAGIITNFVAVKRDVTHEQHLEQQVRQSQKLEAIGQLAGGVAHDFNNIIQAILGYCELLLDNMPGNDVQRARVDEIRQSSMRAAALTRQLLAFSRQEAIKPVVLDVNSVVENIQKMLRRLIGEDVRIVLKLASRLPKTKADAGQIDQVIMNLVVNARDAMPQGGQLTLETSAVTISASQVTSLPEAHPGDFVCLAISDTGVGIPPALLSRIFEPFFSTKGPGRGTGLGLSVVFGIVQQHQGWISVASQEGQGTTFKVFLPATDAPASETAPDKAVPLRGHGERILLVEDEAPVRALSARLLTSNGYSVTTAASAAEAQAVFDKTEPRFDIVFSDVVLPDLNGIELVERLQRQQPGLLVLLCSGYTDERSRWHAIEEKKYRLMQKPYFSSELLHALRDLLHERPPSSPPPP